MKFYLLKKNGSTIKKILNIFRNLNYFFFLKLFQLIMFLFNFFNCSILFFCFDPQEFFFWKLFNWKLFNILVAA